MTQMLGYMSVGSPGCCMQEVFNNCRTIRYLEAIRCGDVTMENVPVLPPGFELDPNCCCPEFDHDVNGCQSFAEGGWNGPWNDTRLSKMSQNALGFWVEEFTLTRGYVSLAQRSREFGRRTLLPGTRVGTIEGWAFGTGAEATAWLIEWLTLVLGKEAQCGLCTSMDAQVWRYCGCPGDNDLLGERMLKNAGGFEVDDITEEWNDDNGVVVPVSVARRFRVTFEVGGSEAQIPSTVRRELSSPWTLDCGDCEDLCPPCVDDGIRNTPVTEYTPRNIGEVELRGDGSLCPLNFDPADFNPDTWEIEVVNLAPAPAGSDPDCPLRVHLVYDGTALTWDFDRLTDWPNDGTRVTEIPCNRTIEIVDVDDVPGAGVAPNSGEGCVNVLLALDGSDRPATAVDWNPVTDLPLVDATVYVDRSQNCIDVCDTYPSRPAINFDVQARTWSPDGWSIQPGFPGELQASQIVPNQDTSPVTTEVIVRTLNPGTGLPQPVSGLCSTVTSVPRPITADVSCWCQPSRVAVDVLRLPLVESFPYRITDLSIAAGSSPLVNARLAIFGAEQSDPDPQLDPAFWSCVEPCAELRIVEIPAGCALRYTADDGLFLDCGGGKTPAGPWLDPLSRWDNPVLQGAYRWFAVLYLPCGVENPAASDGSWAIEATASEVH